MPDANDFISAAAAKPPLFLGIDVGGTNIKIGLVDDEGRTLGYRSIPTQPQDGPAAAVDRCGAACAEIFAESGAEQAELKYVGLATPGPIDIEAGTITGAGQLPTWWNFPLVERLAETCRAPVRFANDANAAAFGEYWKGAGEQFQSMVLYTLGTGVGGGLVIDGNLIEGTYGSGGECGHALIDPHPEARRDSLDKSGSLEAFCGAYAILARTKEALAAGRESSLTERIEAGEELTTLMIAEEAEVGDAFALEIIMETAYYLALGIVSVIHILDPETVVLGGAVTYGGAGHPLGEAFLKKIQDETRCRIFETLRDTLRIEFAQLGGDAGYMGAAGLARLAYQKSN